MSELKRRKTTRLAGEDYNRRIVGIVVPDDPHMELPKLCNDMHGKQKVGAVSHRRAGAIPRPAITDIAFLTI